MPKSGEIHKIRVRRPYWLLVVLALFVAGLAATAGHWHKKNDPHHGECPLCLLSSINGGAAIDVPVLPVVVAQFVFIFLFFTLPTLRGGFSRGYDSHAPPAHF